MKKTLLTVIALVSAQVAFATRAAVQLMPYDRNSASAAPTAPSTVRYQERSAYDRAGSQIGLELGMVGRKQATDSDVLGVQSLMGGRGFLWLPVYNSFTLKPSIGYFFKKEKVGSVSVTQNNFEGGLGLLITAFQGEDVKWHLGVSNRVTQATSTSAIGSSSAKSPADLYFRSGPTTGILVRLGGRIHLVADFEYTWSFERPTRSYMGLSSGLGFEI